MSFGKDRTCKLASCGETVRIWGLQNYDLLHEFSPVQSSYFCGVSWSADGSSLVSVPAYGSAVTITRFPANQSPYNTEINVVEDVNCAKFNGDSTKLLLGCSSGNILSWNILQKKIIKTYAGHSIGVSCLDVNANKTHIASGSANGDILVHNLVSGVYGSSLRANKCQSVRCIRFSPTMKSSLASSNDSGSVDFWDVNKMKPIHSFPRAHGAPATALAYSAINNMLAISVGLDKKIKAYNVNTKRVVSTIIAPFPLTSLDLASNGRTVVVGTSQGHLMTYDLRGGKTPIKTVDAHGISVKDLELKGFRTICKSETLDKLEMPMEALSSSVIHAVDYNSNINQPGRIAQTAAGDSPLENVVFSPIRDVSEMETENFTSPEFRKGPAERRSNSSYGVFSPAREDQLDSPKGNYLSNPDIPTATFLEEPKKNLNLWSAPSMFNRGSDNQAEATFSSATQPHEEATVLFHNADTVVMSRWQTSPPKFFTQDMENLVTSDSTTNSHNSVNSSITKRLSQSPVKLTEDPKMKELSSTIEKKNMDEDLDPNPQAFQTEFLKQLLEDEMENFRVKMQQSYFGVLAQVVKNHVEMKEEIQSLKASLNNRADLWEEVKKLRAENQRLRMAF